MKIPRQVLSDPTEFFNASKYIFIQFIRTSYSPFLIQSLDPDELRITYEGSLLPVEYVNHSIEDITEDIQQIVAYQQGCRAEELAQATEQYFSLLQSRRDRERSAE